MQNKNLINSKIYSLLIALGLGISFVIYKNNHELRILNNLILILLFISILIIIIFNIKILKKLTIFHLCTIYFLYSYLLLGFIFI